MKILQTNGFTDHLVTISCTLVVFSGLVIKMPHTHPPTHPPLPQIFHKKRRFYLKA